MKAFIVLVYVLTSIFVWFPIGMLASLVNLKLTLTIGIFFLINRASLIYLNFSKENK